MIRACRGCGEKVKWSIGYVSQKLEPVNLDGSSHWSTCPAASRFRPPEPGERRSEEGLNVWDTFNEAELRELQRESLRKETEETGVRACRDRPRDAQDGDRFCRACFQPRPASYECPAGKFTPTLLYGLDNGVLVRYSVTAPGAVRVAAKRDYVTLTGPDALSFLARVRRTKNSQRRL